MSRIAYVNGRYVPHAQAHVHIEDRGFQFADSVYEVCEIRAGALIDAPRHLARLQRSLDELNIAIPMAREALLLTLSQVAARNRVRNGMVYLQVTRGVSPRDHAFPKTPIRPSLIVTARALDITAGDARAGQGVSVMTLPETRWTRVDIKTTGLTANVMARQAARAAGHFEAWFVDEHGYIVEGAATNAWIVTREGRVLTRPDDGSILPGVTRATLLDVMTGEGIGYEERAFTVREACQAAEAFCTGATLIVMPVIAIDGQKIGTGCPGPVATRLRAKFHAYACREADKQR